MIVAVDGPAASGKGTIARAIARRFALPHMDTGLLYRAVALNLLRWDGDPESEFAAVRACDFSQMDFDDPELRMEAVGGIASRISAYAHVREALLERQKRFAAQDGGAVLDGRDIGTAVCPGATVKLFVTASAEARAERRLRELRQRGATVIYGDVLQDMKERDARDSERRVAPLAAAPDAVTLDTTGLDADQVFELASDIIARALAAHGP
jgi:cytidylate kinase